MQANWVKQTTSTTGTGSLTLSTVSGFAAFSDRFAVGRNFDYFLLDSSGNPIECGNGYLSSATVLVRETVYETLVGGTLDRSGTAATLSGTTTVVSAPNARGLVPTFPSIPAVGSALGRRIANMPTFQAGSLSTMALSANTLYYMPVFYSAEKDVTTLFIDITTAVAASNVRVGLYSIDKDGLPDVLLADSGSMSGASVTMVSATISAVQLVPGWYYGAVLTDSAISIRSTSVYGESFSGWSNSTARYKNTYGTVTQTYGALPSQATVINTWQNTGSTNNIPLIWLGFA